MFECNVAADYNNPLSSSFNLPPDVKLAQPASKRGKQLKKVFSILSSDDDHDHDYVDDDYNYYNGDDLDLDASPSQIIFEELEQLGDIVPFFLIKAQISDINDDGDRYDYDCDDF